MNGKKYGNFKTFEINLYLKKSIFFHCFAKFQTIKIKIYDDNFHGYFFHPRISTPQNIRKDNYKKVFVIVENISFRYESLRGLI